MVVVVLALGELSRSRLLLVIIAEETITLIRAWEATGLWRRW
jgi:hypothetical protein